MNRKLLFALAAVLFFAGSIRAQNAPEVTVSLNEQFLNSFLDAVFMNLETPKFELSETKKPQPETKKVRLETVKCEQSVTLLREMNGVKTGVKIADGKVVAPIAFTGNYDIPFVGCTNFKGVAEADLNLEYDAAKQILFGRIRVTTVDLNGVPSLAGGVVARFVQGSINKKVNPLEILRADQISAVVPVQYANGAIKLKAKNMRSEIVGNALNVRVAFDFSKAR